VRDGSRAHAGTLVLPGGEFFLSIIAISLPLSVSLFSPNDGSLWFTPTTSLCLIPGTFTRKGDPGIAKACERVHRLVEQLPDVSDPVQIARDTRDSQKENKGE